MDTSTPPAASFAEPRPPKVAHAEPAPKQERPAKKGPVAQAADKLVAERIAAERASITPGKLLVQMDADAGRFVQTLTDANAETVWRYPSEAQLAYSRAVKAYLRTMGKS